MTDAEVLLQNIPLDAGVGNVTLLKTLAWDEARYNTAKQELLQAGLVVTGRGRGGSLKRPGAEGEKPEKVEAEAVPPPVFTSDEEAFLFYVPELPKRVNNGKLRAALGWDEMKYAEVRARLIDEEKVAGCVAGPGGGTKRWEAGDTKAAPVPKEETKAVDLSGFATDDEAFLSLLSADKGTQVKRLKIMLNWDEPRYDEVKARLVEQQKVVSLGGIALRLWKEGDEVKPAKKEKEEIPLVDHSAFASEDDAFMSLVPADGSVGSRYMKAALGWDDEKFQEIRDSLKANKKIMGTQGGGTRLWTVDDEEEETEDTTSDIETPTEIKDVEIFSRYDEGFTVAHAEAIVEKMRTKYEKYSKTKFYVVSEDGVTAIKVRRTQPVAMAREVYDSLRKAAEDAAVELAKPSEPVAEKEAEAGA